MGMCMCTAADGSTDTCGKDACSTNTHCPKRPASRHPNCGEGYLQLGKGPTPKDDMFHQKHRSGSPRPELRPPSGVDHRGGIFQSWDFQERCYLHSTQNLDPGGGFRSPVFGPNETALWSNFAKPVNEPGHRDVSRHTRLTYADGKLFYLFGQPRKRATLRSTDVTLFVPCGSVFARVNESLHNWVIPEADYGKSFDATPGRPFNVSLHEGTKYAKALPWQFTAFKKAVAWGDHLVIKELLCSQPRPPTTRPSKEKCCVRKRIEADKFADKPKSTGDCKLQTLMKSL